MRIRDRIKELRRVKASELLANPKNWRTHPKGQQRALRGILSEIGYADALLARELPDGSLELIDGHLRAETTPNQMVPVLIVDLNEDEANKLLAALDPMAAMAETDTAALRSLLEEMQTQSSGLQAMFDEMAKQAGIELDAAEEPTPDPEPQIDRAAELQKEWRTKRGQVWEIVGKAGTHRLMCGDSTSAEDVSRVMGGAKINVAFTSPPYASQRKYDESSGFKPIPPNEYVAWWEPIQENVKRHLAADGSFFVNIKEAAEDGQKQNYVKRLVIKHIDDWGWRFVDEFCWIRQGIPGDAESMGRFRNAWEPVLWFSAGKPKFHPRQVMHQSTDAFSYRDQAAAGKVIGAKNQGKGGASNSPVAHGSGMAYPSNVIDLKQKAETVGHSDAFPVGLPSFFIKAFSNPGDTVYEPFCGSGTTIIAAESLGRICHGLEISAAYCAVILQRCKDAGMKPKLTTGRN